jgi:hypothetical protein
MSVYVKSGGAWRQATNGHLYIRSGGVWRTASFCYIKTSVGPGGVRWQDSGYRGYPLAPTDIWIGGNNFSSLDVGFSGPGAGGAPISYYQVQELDGNGNPTGRQWNNTTGSLTGIGVSQDQRLQYRVKSVTAAGLESGWYGPVVNRSRIQIGHNEVGHYEYPERWRDWSGSVGFQAGLCRDESAGPSVPNSVLLNRIHYTFYLNFPGTYISKPVAQGNRQVVPVFNGNEFGGPLDISIAAWAQYDTDIGVNNWGGDTGWGLVTHGIGWSSRPVSTAQMLCGAVYLYGQEHYFPAEYVVTTAYAGSYLW